MKKYAFIIAILFYFHPAYSQSNASFAGEIAVFQHSDSINFPPKRAILFVGSSSFRKWTDGQDYFPGYMIINRGFGGSQSNRAGVSPVLTARQKAFSAAIRMV